MVQPTRTQISSVLVSILKGQNKREDVAKWASQYKNRDDVEITDIGAWRYLLTVSYVDSKISPDKYLYELRDIRGWLDEYAKKV